MDKRYIIPDMQIQTVRTDNYCCNSSPLGSWDEALDNELSWDYDQDYGLE